MKITFVKEYKSINQFDEVEITDFCVFAGKNGAGKTHLLKAIENGSVTIDSIAKNKITYFNLQSFLIKNQKIVSARKLEEEKEQAWTRFDQLRVAGQINDDSPQIKEILLRLIRNNPKQISLIETGILHSGLTISTLDKNTFLSMSKFLPDDYELLDSLSELCYDYKLKLIIASLPIHLGGEGKTDEDLSQLEEKSPWNFINKMFEAFGLPHKLVSPPFNAGDIISTGNIEYLARPTFEGKDIGFEDLSSGERILCALAVTVFQDIELIKFPEVLLLDEVDASLHPSMVKNLLSVISDIFLKNNCKVILATHSPTTVSLVEEEAIFEIQNGNVIKKIQKISQSKAVEILSEGIMSLEKGLKLFDQISSKPLSIITEGDNIHHLEKAISILKPELLDKITFIKGTESSSGKDQLKVLFEFFKLAHHTSSVLFVFDCDVNMGQRTEDNNTYYFILPKNEANQLVSKGIENIYTEEIFTEFIMTETDSHQNEVRKFDPKRKKDFTRKVLESSADTVFINFSSFVSKIESLLLE